MKLFTTLRFTLLPVIAVFVISFTSCMKDDQNDPRELDFYSGNIPVVSTRTISGITQSSAISGGRIISDGGAPVTSYGVCWSTLQYPTIEDNSTNDGAGSANYTSMVSNLQIGTTYYLRAFAKNKNGIAYGGQQVFTTENALEIGDIHAGGIIFYLDPSGVHGLVCAEVDQSADAIWGCSGDFIPGADGSLLGTGNTNTAEIIDYCHTSEIAALKCAHLVLNGFDDWFLPSKDELKLVYTNLQVPHFATFSNSAYWSSTEMTNVFAWQIAFSSGIVQGASKSTPSAVRAIRAF